MNTIKWQRPLISSICSSQVCYLSFGFSVPIKDSSMGHLQFGTFRKGLRSSYFTTYSSSGEDKQRLPGRRKRELILTAL